MDGSLTGEFCGLEFVPIDMYLIPLLKEDLML